MESNEDKVSRIKKVKEQYQGQFGDFGDIHTDDVTIYLLDQMIKGTDKLNCLTKVLIILTIILAILTGISVWRLF
jgi:hypothetical protein